MTRLAEAAFGFVVSIASLACQRTLPVHEGAPPRRPARAPARVTTAPSATASTSEQPLRARSAGHWVAVRTGETHACALGAEGDVWCWGSNGAREVGDGCGDACPLPQRAPLSERATDVRLSYGTTCALLESGKVPCWGSRSGRPVTRFEQAAKLVMGDSSSCSIDASGGLVCGGWNRFGRLGFPESEADQRESPVMRPRARVPLAGAVSSAIVLYHSGCALSSSNDLSCWGTSFDCAGPSTVKLSEPVVSIEGGGGAICLLTRSGNVYRYEEMSGSQQPACQLSPNLFSEELGAPVAHGAKAVACHGHHYRACLIDGNEQVACWGTGEGESDRPALVSDLGKTRQVAVGGAFACALSMSGQIKCWGDNRFGQLGRGTTTLQSQPNPAEPRWSDRVSE